MNKILDPTDIKILNILQQDARLDIRQIAVQVHKSTSPVHERIRRLQDHGFIKRYVAVLDREKIGKQLMAITRVSLNVHTQETLNNFAGSVNELPEVQLCLHLSGAYDFILHVIVSDTQAYHDFLVNKLCKLAHVTHVESSFVLRECKMYGPYQL